MPAKGKKKREWQPWKALYGWQPTQGLGKGRRLTARNAAGAIPFRRRK